MKINNLHVVMKTLQFALLDIRIASYEGNTKAAFALSDLIHNLPGAVEISISKNGNCDHALKHLIERAAEKNMTRWLDNALKQTGADI